MTSSGVAVDTKEAKLMTQRWNGRRGAGVVAVAATASMLAAACSGSSSPNKTPDATGSASSSAASVAPSSPSTPASPAQSTNGQKVTLTFWTWLPKMDQEVTLFEQSHPDITIQVVNAGQGAADYQKLRTAFKAGSGAPDLAQVEYQVLPSFEVTKNLTDISGYGAAGVKADYAASTWSQVTQGNAIYAIPQDIGPMGLVYRKDIFTKYNIAVPKTWDEFATAAQQLHAADPKISITDLPPGDPGEIEGLFWQAGAQHFSLQGSDSLKVSIDDQATQRVAQYWQNLIAKNYVATDADFTDQWYKALSTGTYATWITAAWGPLFLQGIAKGTDGDWAVAPLPAWTAGQASSAMWGGSTTAVTSQSKHPKEAAEFAIWLNHDPAAVKLLATQQNLYPALTSYVQGSDFQSQTLSLFGDQQINAVFSDAATHVPANWQWSPFQDYVYTQFQNTVGKAMTSKGSWVNALNTLQSAVVGYAKQQGFTVQPG
jgi:multiple sugar transport system substrate-binding protein